MDHRVSAERETADLASAAYSGPPPVDANSWWKARDRYFREEIRAGAPRLSAYLRPPNRLNLVAKVAHFDLLVHVGCLNRMLLRVLQGVQATDVEVALQRLLGRATGSRLAGSAGIGWSTARAEDLANRLLRQPDDVTRQVAGLLSDALGESQGPWWACFSEEIQPFLDGSDPIQICAALGLGHLRNGDWLLVWQYPVIQALPLYRPTVAEANDSPYHFPSPPGYGLGITMPLHTVIPACREVIHRPLKGIAAVERCTGKLLKVADFVYGDVTRIPGLRDAHRQRLDKEFATPALGAWLDRHPEVR
jgi:hypothetical protein